MERGGWRRSVVLLLLLGAASLGVCGQNGGLAAQVLTNEGKTLRGELAGIRSPIRLDVGAFAASIGPDQAYDIPLPTVRQITVDFPRVVIETVDRVFIGPFSAFRGIPQSLTLHRGDETSILPVASLRAIAVNGEAIHPVPHEWLADRFLVVPTVFPAPWVPMKPHRETNLVPPFSGEPALAGLSSVGPVAGATQAPATTPATPVDLTGFYETPPVETPAETPWWVGALVLIAVVAVLYLVTAGSSS